jgi:hypothetical protein
MFWTQTLDSITDLPAWCERPAVARILGVTTKSLQRAERDGYLLAYKPNGSRVFYKRSEVINLNARKGWRKESKQINYRIKRSASGTGD